MNRTYMEHAKSMRLHARFPLQFWADVVDIVVYLINIRPLIYLNGGIPVDRKKGKLLISEDFRL
jgi:hypothetical protein